MIEEKEHMTLQDNDFLLKVCVFGESCLCAHVFAAMSPNLKNWSAAGMSMRAKNNYDGGPSTS